jgi:hypothetical protein
MIQMDYGGKKFTGVGHGPTCSPIIGFLIVTRVEKA